MESAITIQWYLQKLQDEVIPLIQGAGHVDTIYFQQHGASSLRHRFQTGYGAHPAYLMGTGGSFPGGK